jgi:hypothetical protein
MDDNKVYKLMEEEFKKDGFSNKRDWCWSWDGKMVIEFLKKNDLFSEEGVAAAFDYIFDGAY